MRAPRNYGRPVGQSAPAVPVGYARRHTLRVSEAFSTARVQAAYDVVARDYRAAFGDDLRRLPLDRRLLDEVVRDATGGVVLDLGCGTGSAGSYMAAQGARVVGVDISAGMLEACRSDNRFPLCRGDMRRLPFGDAVFAAAVAFYSVHHIRRPELGLVLAEAARVLGERGRLLLATHLGEGEIYTDTFLGHPIATTGGTLYSPREITDQLASAGFAAVTTERRAPLAHEHQTERIYLLASRVG